MGLLRLVWGLCLLGLVCNGTDAGFHTKSLKQNPAEAIVAEAQQQPMTSHPFFQRLRSEPPNLTALWSFYQNLYEVTDKVPGWLVNIVQHTRDIRFQAFLVTILYDELGSGDPDRIHSTLMNDTLKALQPYARSPSTPAVTVKTGCSSVNSTASRSGIRGENGWPSPRVDPAVAGRRLAKQMADFFLGGVDVNQAIGSLIAGEVYAEQMIEALAQEVRRQKTVPLEEFQWQLEHEKVESGHAEVSDLMSKIVPTSGNALERCRYGAAWKRATLWDWLDGIYEAAYQESVPNVVSDDKESHLCPITPFA